MITIDSFSFARPKKIVFMDDNAPSSAGVGQQRNFLNYLDLWVKPH